MTTGKAVKTLLLTESWELRFGGTVSAARPKESRRSKVEGPRTETSDSVFLSPELCLLGFGWIGLILIDAGLDLIGPLLHFLFLGLRVVMASGYLSNVLKSP